MRWIEGNVQEVTGEYTRNTELGTFSLWEQAHLGTPRGGDFLFLPRANLSFLHKQDSYTIRGKHDLFSDCSRLCADRMSVSYRSNITPFREPIAVQLSIRIGCEIAA